MWAKTMVAADPSLAEVTDGRYRMPKPGDPVTVSGMRRRPELNGARAEIVSSGLDEHGRVTVRVFDSAIPGMGESRKMKIQHYRLVPQRSASTPSLLRSSGSFADDHSSVMSCSRQSSSASGFGNRALGSAISATARSTLSNKGRF